MTREEAIKVLEMFLHKQCDLARTEFAYDANTVWEAVNMASKALEQEPCENSKLDEWEIKGKPVEAWLINGKLQIRALGSIHNIPLPFVKQEPCEDAISRKAINNLCDDFQRSFPLSAQTMKLFSLEVRNLPPVNPQEPKTEWIPVDYDRYPETYPKAFQEVWITDAYGEVKHRAYDGTRSIKAWMPYEIPAPYKTESEEK